MKHLVSSLKLYRITTSEDDMDFVEAPSSWEALSEAEPGEVEWVKVEYICDVKYIKRWTVKDGSYEERS